MSNDKRDQQQEDEFNAFMDAVNADDQEALEEIANNAWEYTPTAEATIFELNLDFRTYSDNPNNPYTPLALAHWESQGVVEIGDIVYQFMFSEQSSCVYKNQWQDGKLILIERVEIEGYIPSQLESQISAFKLLKARGFRDEEDTIPESKSKYIIYRVYEDGSACEYRLTQEVLISEMESEYDSIAEFIAEQDGIVSRDFETNKNFRPYKHWWAIVTETRLPRYKVSPVWGGVKSDDFFVFTLEGLKTLNIFHFGGKTLVTDVEKNTTMFLTVYQE